MPFIKTVPPWYNSLFLRGAKFSKPGIEIALFIGCTPLQFHTSGGLDLDRADPLTVVEISKENGEIQYYGSAEARAPAGAAQPLETAAVAGGANALPRTCEKEVWDSALLKLFLGTERAIIVEF